MANQSNLPCPVCGGIEMFDAHCPGTYSNSKEYEICANCGVVLNPNRKPKKPIIQLEKT